MLFLGAMFPQVLRMLLLCMGLSTIATILLTDLGMRPCMNSPRGGDSGKVYGCISASTPVVFTYNLFYYIPGYIVATATTRLGR